MIISKRKFGIITVGAALLWSGQATADQEGTFFGQEARGKWIIGVKGGTVKASEPDFDDADNFGVVVGYEFARPVGFDGKASLEIEVTNTSDEGGIGPNSDFGSTGEWDVDTVGIFFAYRTPGMVYFKGKLGGMQSDLTAKFIGSKISRDDTALAYGAGLGVKIGEIVKVELEYTGTTGDNELDLLTLGGLVLF